MDFWYLLISFKATVPGRNLWGFFTPPFGAFTPLFLAALAALAACTARSAAFFLAMVFLISSWIALTDPVLCPGFKAGLLPPPVVLLGPGGNIPGFGSGGSPVDGPFGLSGVSSPISSSSCSCCCCNLVQMTVLIALFILMSSPVAGIANAVST